jgi:hypothetical protein
VTEAYRVPKRKVPVEVVLAGRSPLLVDLYLSDCAETHAGPERPSDLLNGPEPFLPASDRAGSVLFLHRDGLIAVSVDAQHEQADASEPAGVAAAGQSTAIGVEVVLEDGMTIAGEINQMMPEGQRRLQDVLNLASRFLILWSGGRVHLINKRRIVRVATLPQSREAVVGAHR